MPDDAQPDALARVEHRLDQLIWRLTRIEGDLADVRKALNAFRADVTLLRQRPAPSPDNDNGNNYDSA